jgi:hypothetical protein
MAALFGALQGIVRGLAIMAAAVKQMMRPAFASAAARCAGNDAGAPRAFTPPKTIKTLAIMMAAAPAAAPSLCASPPSRRFVPKI